MRAHDYSSDAHEFQPRDRPAILSCLSHRQVSGRVLQKEAPGQQKERREQITEEQRHISLWA